NEVGIENSDEFALRDFQSFGQGAGFESFAIAAMVVGDGVAGGGIAFYQFLGDANRLVGGVIEHLDVELLFGVVKPAHRVQQSLDDELFVEDGKLHGDAWQLGKTPRRLGGAVPLVLVVEVNQHIAVDSIGRQQDEHREIGDQEQNVEGVGVIQALEGA